MVWLVVGPSLPPETFRKGHPHAYQCGLGTRRHGVLRSISVLPGRKIRQHIEKKRQDNKNVSQENIVEGWSPPTDYVLPFLEEQRANWINKKTTG